MLRSVDVHDHPGREVVAGITVAAVAVPGVIGYAHIAGMPIVTGLYTMIIPATVFVVLCSSRHLVVGADSTTAAILAAGLTPLAAVGSAEYVELAAMVAILTGAMLLVARLAGLRPFHRGDPLQLMADAAQWHLFEADGRALSAPEEQADA